MTAGLAQVWELYVCMSFIHLYSDSDSFGILDCGPEYIVDTGKDIAVKVKVADILGWAVTSTPYVEGL